RGDSSTHVDPKLGRVLMVREKACRSVLITVGLLLVFTVLGSAQSRKRGQQNTQGATVVPATPTASPAERRVTLVIGNAAYQYTNRILLANSKVSKSVYLTCLLGRQKRLGN